VKIVARIDQLAVIADVVAPLTGAFVGPSVGMTVGPHVGAALGKKDGIVALVELVSSPEGPPNIF
jgi:hypothetical protein